MGIKKKRNVIILTLCMVTSFIIYQLYFFFTITSEIAATSRAGSTRIQPVLDSDSIKLIHLRSEEDKFINDNGVIRGIFQQHMLHYRPDTENRFKCLTSEQRVPFGRVNDDYCDCEDGSDEPSTSACPSGVFACDYQSKRKPVSVHTIPSSKVNDGICDCCDGSDEFLYRPDEKILTQTFADNFALGPYRMYAKQCNNVC